MCVNSAEDSRLIRLYVTIPFNCQIVKCAIKYDACTEMHIKLLNYFLQAEKHFLFLLQSQVSSLV